MTSTRAAAANRWIVGAAVAAAILILTVQLFVPPVVGLADNGDYERVMSGAGLAHSTDSYAQRYFSFLRTTYAFQAGGGFRGAYLTSETGLALVARALGSAAGGALFDIRILAGIHVALFALALVLLLRACRDLAPAAQAVAAALLVFFFTDVGYVAPFNSFYSQTASLLFLLLLAGIVATAIRRGDLEGSLAVAYFVCAALFLASKPQEAIQGLLLALFGLRLASAGRRAKWKSFGVALALLLCGFAVWYGRRTPTGLREAALYQVVFAEILPHSPDPRADAARLGLDPDWVRYSGTNAFQDDSPLRDATFRVRFLEGTGYRKVLRFYLGEPTRFAERVARASAKMWSLRPSYGNLEKSDAFPVRTLTDRFAAWSGLRLRLFGPHALGWLALLYGANAAFALGTWRGASTRGRLAREAVLVAIIMSVTAFLVCLLTNAPPDFSRVFYVAEALCDLLLVADAAWLVQRLSADRRIDTASA